MKILDIKNCLSSIQIRLLITRREILYINIRKHYKINYIIILYN